MFLFHGRESHPRSIVKAISWRTLGSIDTFILSLFFTSSATLAGSIALTEVFTKIVLYYGHERVWAVVPWGSALPAEDHATGEHAVPRDATDSP